MKPSVPDSSWDVQQLLSTERDLPAVPEPVRRRAMLRARTALWHVRHDVASHAVPRSRRLAWLKATLAAMSIAGVSFAGWVFTGDTESTPTAQLANALPHQRSTPGAGPSADGDCSGPSCVGPTQSSPAAQPPPSVAQPVVTGQSSPKVRQPPQSTASPRGAPGLPLPADVELLDAARRALTAQDYQGALRHLRRHEQLFTSSPLSEERDALQVMALKGAGRAKDAKQAASGFDKRHPNSVLGPSLSQPHGDVH